MKEYIGVALVATVAVFAILVWHEALSTVGVFGAWR